MKRRRTNATVSRLGVFGCELIAVQISGCFPCGTYGDQRLLKARLLDSETLEAPADVIKIAAWTSTDGEYTGSGSGGRTILPSPEDGSFELWVFSSDFVSSCGSSVPGNIPEFPPPDEIRVIVEREDCEQTFSIDINEDTVMDMTFPDDTLELKDPILVPPCGLESGN